MDNNHGIEKEAIPFIPSDELKKSSYLEVKYTISGFSFKTQLPVFKGGPAEELLRFINKFQGVKGKVGYNNYRKLESGTEQLLQGTAKDEWSTIKVEINLLLAQFPGSDPRQCLASDKLKRLFFFAMPMK